VLHASAPEVAGLLDAVSGDRPRATSSHLLRSGEKLLLQQRLGAGSGIIQARGCAGLALETGHRLHELGGGILRGPHGAALRLGWVDGETAERPIEADYA